MDKIHQLKEAQRCYTTALETIEAISKMRNAIFRVGIMGITDYDDVILYEAKCHLMSLTERLKEISADMHNDIDT